MAVNANKIMDEAEASPGGVEAKGSKTDPRQLCWQNCLAYVDLCAISLGSTGCVFIIPNVVVLESH